MPRKQKVTESEFSAEVRRAFLIWLANSNLDVTDKTAFRKIVQASIVNCGLTPAEIAKTVGYSPSNVSRWSRGLTAPHETARVPIIEKIKAMIQARDKRDPQGG